jgi:hypothetical protein
MQAAASIAASLIVGDRPLAEPVGIQTVTARAALAVDVP